MILQNVRNLLRLFVDIGVLRLLASLVAQDDIRRRSVAFSLLSVPRCLCGEVYFFSWLRRSAAQPLC